LRRLEQALVRLDIGAVSSAIEAIRAYHPSLADSLEAVANELQFGRMLEEIRAAAGKTDQENETCLKR
jgi:pilus assembly protein TadC